MRKGDKFSYFPVSLTYTEVIIIYFLIKILLFGGFFFEQATDLETFKLLFLKSRQ